MIERNSNLENTTSQNLALSIPEIKIDIKNNCDICKRQTKNNNFCIKCQETTRKYSFLKAAKCSIIGFSGGFCFYGALALTNIVTGTIPIFSFMFSGSILVNSLFNP